MARRKPTTDSPLTILTVNGTAYVAGLVWLPLKSARNYKAEAKALGKADRRPLAVIRHGRTVTQAGFARRERNVKGMYSLAAALAGVLGEDFIGVFDAGADHYALIAARRGGILPGRDVVGGFDAIAAILRETYNEMSAESDGVATRVIAPAIFEFGDDAATLADLLHSNELRPEYRLRALALATSELAIAAAVLVAVGASVYGYGLWHTKQLRAKAADDANLAVQVAAASAPPSAPAQDVVKPWVTLPAARVVLDACRDYWDSVPVAIAGWRFTAGQCGPTGASRTYRRDGGNVEAFGRALAPGAAPAYSDAFSTATLATPITLPVDATDVLPALATRERAVTAYIQRIDTFANASIALKPVPPPVDGEPAPVTPWTTHTLTVTSPLPPDVLLANLDLAGLRVLDIAVTLDESAALNWTTTGEFYAQ